MICSYCYKSSNFYTTKPMNRNYLIREIKDLSKNFNSWQEKRILELVEDHHFNTNKLKSLYDDLMKDVYGDGGIKGY